MIALKIEDVKQFTSKLFVGTTFDKLLVREVTIVTYNSFSIDGHIKQGYYTDEELEEHQIEEFSSWAALKPFCFSLIKGKKLPGSFQIVFQMAPKHMEAFLSKRQLSVPAEQVNGLYMNIRYEDGVITCVTGTSMNFFTLDKSLDREWDEAVKLFLKGEEIAFLEE